MLGDTFDLEIDERESTLEMPSAEEYWQEFSPGFGPLETLLESSDEARQAEIHDAFVAYLESNFGSPSGEIRHTREYLLVTGTRR